MAITQEELLRILRDSDEIDTLEVLYLFRAHLDILKHKKLPNEAGMSPLAIEMFDVDDDEDSYSESIGKHVSYADACLITYANSETKTIYFYEFTVSPEVFEFGYNYGSDCVQELIEAIQSDDKVKSNLTTAINAIQIGVTSKAVVQLSNSPMPTRISHQV
jgi:hypothetical protein